MKTLIAAIVMAIATVASGAATTRPTTQPAGAPEARASAPDTEGLLNTLLAPRPADDVIQPLPDYPKENAASTGVAPNTPAIKLRPQGYIVQDRVGRLEKTPEGRWEFRYEADGQSMQDPPVLVLESLELMLMETAMKRATAGHLRFRITGELTTYGGRNYVLIHKFVVVGPENPLRKAGNPDRD